MSIDRMPFVLLALCVAVLAAGCSSQPKATPADAQGAPAQEEAVSSAPAKAGDVSSALESAQLKLQADDKVWIVSAEGKKPRYVGASRVAEQALRKIATQRDKATVLDSSTPALTNVLELYETKPVAEIPDEDLVSAARAAGATKVLAYRAKAVEVKAPGAPPFLESSSADEPIDVEARVIDVASGKTVAVAEVGTPAGPSAAQQGKAGRNGSGDPKDPSLRAYPLRVVEPQYLSHPDVPNPVQESNLFGRRYRAFTRLSDKLGPEGLYDDQGYQEWTRINDQIGPEPFYSAEPTLMIITTTPTSARVFVNGMDCDVTPCWLPLEEGDKVVITKQGFIQEEFVVPEQRRTIHIDLRPR